MSWYHELFRRLNGYCTALIIEKYFENHHAKKIREINSLVTYLVKTLLWRKKCWFSHKIVIAFYTAHSVKIPGILHMYLMHFWQKARESNGFTKISYQRVVLTKYFSGEREFLVFHTVQPGRTVWKNEKFS